LIQFTDLISNLLTHSSGLSYEFIHPKIKAWSKWINAQYRSGAIPKPASEITRIFLRPLLYEPDQGWSYGYGTDWAGIAVSRVSDISLEEFMQHNIWGPLGMKSTTFYPRARPDLFRRTASLVERDEDGKLRPFRPSPTFTKLPGDIYSEGGGGACYGTANDFIKLLTSLLRNDGKLLKPETVDMMFKPQLKNPIHLRRVRANPLSYSLAGNIPPQTPVDFGFGGILNGDDILATGRSKGSMQWGGLPNLMWWIDPRHGVCGCYWSQLLPPGDPQSLRLHDEFEKAVLDSLKANKSSNGRL
jgi:CubicO group peptidase (beta-lactamase class C family)